MRTTLGLTAAAATLLAALAPAASASFPGRNGKLAVSSNSCLRQSQAESVRQIRAYSAGSGRDLGALTACDTPTSGPDWTADGQRLGFTLAPRSAHASFMSIDDSGGDPRPTGVPAGPTPLSFAPGGKRFVFERDDELWIAHADGSGERKFLGRTCTDDCIEFRNPRWSPDGGRIAFEAFVARPNAGLKRSGIHVVGARRGKGLRRVSPNGHDVDWSPGGKRLVFRSAYRIRYNSGGASGGNLVVVGANGKGRRRLLHTKDTAALAPSWSPDGRSIAYVDAKFGSGSMARNYAMRLRRMPARGGRPRTLARLPYYADTDFEYEDPEISWRPVP